MLDLGLRLARCLRGRCAGWVDAQSCSPHIHHPGSIRLERLCGPELSSPPTGDPHSVCLSVRVQHGEDPCPSMCGSILLVQPCMPLPLPWMDVDRGLDAGTGRGCDFCFSAQCSHDPEPGTLHGCGQSLFQTPPRPALLGSQDRALHSPWRM